MRRAGGSSGPRFDLNFGKSLDWLREIYRKPWFLPSNIGLSCKISHHPILCVRDVRGNMRGSKVQTQRISLGDGIPHKTYNLRKVDASEAADKINDTID